jgi:hypothetical protein
MGDRPFFEQARQAPKHLFRMLSCNDIYDHQGIYNVEGICFCRDASGLCWVPVSFVCLKQPRVNSFPCLLTCFKVVLGLS